MNDLTEQELLLRELVYEKYYELEYRDAIYAREGISQGEALEMIELLQNADILGEPLGAATCAEIRASASSAANARADAEFPDDEDPEEDDANEIHEGHE